MADQIERAVTDAIVRAVAAGKSNKQIRSLVSKTLPKPFELRYATIKCDVLILQRLGAWSVVRAIEVIEREYGLSTPNARYIAYGSNDFVTVEAERLFKAMGKSGRKARFTAIMRKLQDGNNLVSAAGARH